MQNLNHESRIETFNAAEDVSYAEEVSILFVLRDVKSLHRHSVSSNEDFSCNSIAVDAL